MSTLARAACALALLALFGLAGPVAAAPVTVRFDTLAEGANPNLYPVALAGGITFTSAYLTADLDANGDEILDPSGNLIPGFTHWTTYVDGDLHVVSPIPFGRGPAPSAPNMLNALFDQTLIGFARPARLSGFAFTKDPSSFGDLFAAQVLLLDAAGKTIAASPDFFGSGAGTITWDFAPVTVNAILLPSTRKLYDDLTFVFMPEPASVALLATALGLLGAAGRRRPV